MYYVIFSRYCHCEEVYDLLSRGDSLQLQGLEHIIFIIPVGSTALPDSIPPHPESNERLKIVSLWNWSRILTKVLELSPRP